jgi:hypothetical protein
MKCKIEQFYGKMCKINVSHANKFHTFKIDAINTNLPMWDMSVYGEYLKISRHKIHCDLWDITPCVIVSLHIGKLHGVYSSTTIIQMIK